MCRCSDHDRLQDEVRKQSDSNRAFSRRQKLFAVERCVYFTSIEATSGWGRFDASRALPAPLFRDSPSRFAFWGSRATADPCEGGLIPGLDHQPTRGDPLLVRYHDLRRELCTTNQSILRLQ